MALVEGLFKSHFFEEKHDPPLAARAPAPANGHHAGPERRGIPTIRGRNAAARLGLEARARAGSGISRSWGADHKGRQILE